MTNDKNSPTDKIVGSTDGLGGCGHFCEACARRDDKIKEMRGQLLWALYHHQGGSSVVGQPIRKVLGIGEYDHMTHEQIEEAQIAAGVLAPKLRLSRAARMFRIGRRYPASA